MYHTLTLRAGSFAAALIGLLLFAPVAFADHGGAEPVHSHATTLKEVVAEQEAYYSQNLVEKQKIEQMQSLIVALTQLLDLLKHKQEHLQLEHDEHQEVQDHEDDEHNHTENHA